MSVPRHAHGSVRGLFATQSQHCRIVFRPRHFSSSVVCCEEVARQNAADSSTSTLEPHLVATPKKERRLASRRSLTPVTSRRRRAILQSSQQVPFEQLPYQCFQEARRVLQADREEKVRQIDGQRGKLERVRTASTEPQNQAGKERRVKSLEDHIEELKIYADINDPIVKRKFEDGQGDMNKPIYRFLEDRRWREYKRKLVMQRITQMNVVPDVLPSIDPTVSVDLSFRSRAVQPGEFVDSRVSEIPARLGIQPFSKGQKLVTVAVVNPDVPDVAKDGFNYRCHFLACNIPVSPTSTRVSLGALDTEAQVALPWLPAYTQRGAPYSRMSIFIFEQPDSSQIDVAQAKTKVQREGFILRSFADKHALKPIGVNMYRSQWDEGTAGVMQRAGIIGHDVEFKRMKVEPLPYKKLPGSRYR